MTLIHYKINEKKTPRLEKFGSKIILLSSVYLKNCLFLHSLLNPFRCELKKDYENDENKFMIKAYKRMLSC